MRLGSLSRWAVLSLPRHSSSTFPTWSVPFLFHHHISLNVKQICLPQLIIWSFPILAIRSIFWSHFLFRCPSQNLDLISRVNQPQSMPRWEFQRPTSFYVAIYIVLRGMQWVTYFLMGGSNSAGVEIINTAINEGKMLPTHWRDFSTRLKTQRNLKKMRRMWRWPPPTSASSSSSGSSSYASFSASSSVLSGHFCCHLILIHCCQHIVDD